jgi:hypothetical protein
MGFISDWFRNWNWIVETNQGIMYSSPLNRDGFNFPFVARRWMRIVMVLSSCQMATLLIFQRNIMISSQGVCLVYCSIKSALDRIRQLCLSVQNIKTSKHQDFQISRSPDFSWVYFTTANSALMCTVQCTGEGFNGVLARLVQSTNFVECRIS